MGLGLFIALLESEDEVEMAVSMQSLALETVTWHGRWPPFGIH